MAAKLLVPANKRWSCGKDLAGQGKGEPQHLPAVSSGRVESSVPNWEKVRAAWALDSLGISLLPLERDPVQTQMCGPPTATVLQSPGRAAGQVRPCRLMVSCSDAVSVCIQFIGFRLSSQ